MAEADIKLLMELSACSREKAEETLNQVGSVDAALEVLIEFPKPKFQLPSRPKKNLDDVQKHLAEVRKTMEDFDRQRESTSANQHGYEGQVELLNPHAETAPQSNCSPECQQPSQG